MTYSYTFRNNFEWTGVAVRMKMDCWHLNNYEIITPTLFKNLILSDPKVPSTATYQLFGFKFQGGPGIFFAFHTALR